MKHEHPNKPTFMGFRRPSGKPGVRNDIWIVPTTDRILEELHAIASECRKAYWIDNLCVLKPPFHNTLCDEQTARTADILAGFVLNPNAAGVILAGFDCEALHVGMILERIGEDAAIQKVRTVLLGENFGADIPEHLDSLAANAPRVRERFPVRMLTVGVAGTPRYRAVLEDIVAEMGAKSITTTNDNLDDGPDALAYLAACGAQVSLYADEHTIPFGNIVPTIRIANTLDIAENFPHWADIHFPLRPNIATTFEAHEARKKFASHILQVASGSRTAQEERCARTNTKPWDAVPNPVRGRNPLDPG